MTDTATYFNTHDFGSVYKEPVRNGHGSEIHAGDVVYLKCTVSEQQHKWGNMIRLEASDAVVYASKEDILTAHDIMWTLEDEDDGK